MEWKQPSQSGILLQHTMIVYLHAQVQISSRCLSVDRSCGEGHVCNLPWMFGAGAEFHDPPRSIKVTQGFLTPPTGMPVNPQPKSTPRWSAGHRRGAARRL